MKSESASPDSPIHLAIVGGTGLADRLVAGFAEVSESIAVDTPFGEPSAPIQTGLLPDGRTRLSLLARHGEEHLLNPNRVPYRANIFALKKIGVTHLIASGAVGSLRDTIHPGEIALVNQFIDKTHNRASTFFENAAVHVEFSQPCCPVMRQWLIDAAAQLQINYHSNATYVCMEGPAFSTKAESEMHRQWGGDLIGMTALPEAKLAREAEIAYALIALPTDYDAWRQHDHDIPHDSLLAEIMGNLNEATDACVQLIRKSLEDVSFLQKNKSPAYEALSLAIWSDKSKIDTAEIERLKPLWGKYFQ